MNMHTLWSPKKGEIYKKNFPTPFPKYNKRMPIIIDPSSSTQLRVLINTLFGSSSHFIDYDQVSHMC